MKPRFQAELLTLAGAALEAVEPRALVRAALADEIEAGRLAGAPTLLALGKAAAGMALGALEALPGGFAQALALLPPRAMDPDPDGNERRLAAGGCRVLRGAHPVPDASSVVAGRAALDLARAARGPLVVLLSGGGSALAVAPREGVSPRELQDLHRALLESGAPIREVNARRAQVDALKGGGLARAAAGATRVLGLALSDVVGSPPEAIASGPLTPGAELRILGDGPQAARAACAAAGELGAQARLVDAAWEGEAGDLGTIVARESLAAVGSRSPVALVWAGESTVRMDDAPPVGPGRAGRRRGRGGPNQEAALTAAVALDGRAGVGALFFGTDGIDGPTPAAGGFADDATVRLGTRGGASAQEALARHDAFAFLQAAGRLWRPGPTGTNVADLALAWVAPQKA